MEPHAHKHEFSFDPIIDTPEWRAEHGRRTREYARKMIEELGPIDPKLREQVRAEVEAAASTWPE